MASTAAAPPAAGPTRLVPPWLDPAQYQHVPLPLLIIGVTMPGVWDRSNG